MECGRVPTRSRKSLARVRHMLSEAGWWRESVGGDRHPSPAAEPPSPRRAWLLSVDQVESGEASYVCCVYPKLLQKMAR